MKNKILTYALFFYTSTLIPNTRSEIDNTKRRLAIELAAFKHRAKIGKPSKKQMAFIVRLQSKIQELNARLYIENLESRKRGSF